MHLDVDGIESSGGQGFRVFGAVALRAGEGRAGHLGDATIRGYIRQPHHPICQRRVCRGIELHAGKAKHGLRLGQGRAVEHQALRVCSLLIRRPVTPPHDAAAGLHTHARDIAQIAPLRFSHPRRQRPIGQGASATGRVPGGSGAAQRLADHLRPATEPAAHRRADDGRDGHLAGWPRRDGHPRLTSRIMTVICG